MVLLIRTISIAGNAIVLLLFIRAILSWFQIDYGSQFWKLRENIEKITEPIVKPFRDFLSRFNTGMLDLSVLAAMITVQVVVRVLAVVLTLFMQ